MGHLSPFVRQYSANAPSSPKANTTINAMTMAFTTRFLPAGDAALTYAPPASRFRPSA